jgi:hypothetical protein
MLTSLSNTIRRLHEHHVNERGLVEAAAFTARLVREFAADLSEGHLALAETLRGLAHKIESALWGFEQGVTESLDRLDRICRQTGSDVHSQRQ